MRVDQPLMAGGLTSTGDRLGERLDLKKLLQLGRRAIGSGNIAQSVNRASDRMVARRQKQCGYWTGH
jgi:hypothetical protein